MNEKTIWELLNIADTPVEGIIPKEGPVDPILSIAQGLLLMSDNLSKGFKEFTRTKFRGIILMSEKILAEKFLKFAPNGFPKAHIRGPGQLYKVWVHIPFYTGVLPVPGMKDLLLLSRYENQKDATKRAASDDLDIYNRIRRMATAFPVVYGRDKSKPQPGQIATFQWFNATQKFTGLYFGSESKQAVIQVLQTRSNAKAP